MDYLDSEGLTYYDSKIKRYTDDIIETSVLPMIPKKGVVAEGNNGYVTGGQVYSVIGGGGSGEGKYPFSYIKFGKCRKLMLQSVSYFYLTGASYHRYYRKGLADILDVKFYNDSLYYLPYYTITASSNETNTNYIAIGREFIKDTMKPEEDDPYILNPLDVGQELDVSIRYSEFNGGLLNESSSTSYSDSNKYFKGNKALDVIAESMELHNYTHIGSGWMYSPDHSFNVSNLFIYDNLKCMDEYAIKSTPYIYIYAVQPPVIQVNSFVNSSLIKEIHVPSGSLDLYKSANNWSAYADYMIGDL